MENEKQENNNLDIDTLLDEVLSDNADQSVADVDKNRIKSAKEVAQTELFAVPQQINLEEIDKNLNIPSAKPESDINNAEIADNSAKTLSPDKLSKEDLKNVQQEKIDLDNAPKAFYNTDETVNERNYKKVLGKLVKSSDIETEPFKVEPKDEKGLQENESTDDSKLLDTLSSPSETVLAARVETAEKGNSENKISVRTFTPKAAVDDLGKYLFLNKARISTLASVTAVALIETLIMYFVINSINPVHRVYYYIAALVSVIPLGVGIFIYAFNPDKISKRKFSYATMFLNAFIVTVVLAVIMLVIVLLSSISLTDPTDYAPKVILPCLFILNYPIGVAFFTIYTKTSVFRADKTK